MTEFQEDAILWNGNPKYSSNYLVEWIKLRVMDYNKNFLGIFCGPTGSGKSYSALRLAEVIDPDFSVNQVVFTVKEFMELLNSDTLKRGQVVIFDEAGTGLSKKEWYSVSNKMFNYILQTFRYKNLVVMFTTPNLDFIDSGSRALFHMYFETMRIEQNRNLSIVKPKLILTNHNTSKTYFKFLRLIHEGRTDMIDQLVLKKASAKLLREYEEKKRKFADELNKRVEAEVTKIEDEARKETSKVLSDKQKNVLKLMAEGWQAKQIAEITNSSINQVFSVINAMKKKGIQLPGREKSQSNTSSLSEG